MKNIKKMLIVLLLGTMISAIEITTRMGLFIIFALGVATIVSSLVLFRRVKFMRNLGLCFGGLFMVLAAVIVTVFSQAHSWAVICLLVLFFLLTLHEIMRV